jgi:hypothetical protein
MHIWEPIQSFYEQTSARVRPLQGTSRGQSHSPERPAAGKIILQNQANRQGMTEFWLWRQLTPQAGITVLKGKMPLVEVRQLVCQGPYFQMTTIDSKGLHLGRDVFIHL